MATAALRHPAPKLVSVVVPVRNGADTLSGQLRGLAGQTYAGEWEVVVADNGSTDSTRAIAELWRPELPHLRVVDAGASGGPAAARNRGAAAAEGEFLAFCDADDIVTPDWLASLVEAGLDHDIVTGVL